MHLPFTRIALPFAALIGGLLVPAAAHAQSFSVQFGAPAPAPYYPEAPAPYYPQAPAPYYAAPPAPYYAPPPAPVYAPPPVYGWAPRPIVIGPRFWPHPHLWHRGWGWHRW